MVEEEVEEMAKHLDSEYVQPCKIDRKPQEHFNRSAVIGLKEKVQWVRCH
jgi:hypothetical protein